MTTYLVTGGAGFIGSALVRQLIADTDIRVVNVDRLTYAGNLDSLGECLQSPRYAFYEADICDGEAMREIIGREHPDVVLHLAAESHVDRSIDSPGEFVRTNVVGTFTVLQESLRFWRGLDAGRRRQFRVIHVSTDEVYGALGAVGSFSESTPYAPTSPYSASKAGSDHLARAWNHTYELPVIVTNCSNNFGPYQFPEKLIPLVIGKAVSGQSIPVYGEGGNIRDWLFVDDHVRALRLVAEQGRPGDTYNIGGGNERRNLDVVKQICKLLDELRPDSSGEHERLISFVRDRPGHDYRYAIDASKIHDELGWQPEETFTSALRKTVEWYLANEEWTRRVTTGAYKGERLGHGVPVSAS